MIEKVLHPRNLTKAYHSVVSNKGSSGIDGMQVDKLKSYIDQNRSKTALNILNRKYMPTAIKGVELSEANHEHNKKMNEFE